MARLSAELIAAARRGDEAALAGLIAHMSPAIRRGASLCAGVGLEYEDAMQEGIIALLRAIQTFDPDRASFEPYAAACIRHAQFSARRAAQRKKNEPLLNSLPLDALEAEPNAASPGPEELAIQSEAYDAWVRRMDTILSPLERAALHHFMAGESYPQIAVALGRTPKAVENALSRARRKLRETPFP